MASARHATHFLANLGITESFRLGYTEINLSVGHRHSLKSSSKVLPHLKNLKYPTK